MVGEQPKSCNGYALEHPAPTFHPVNTSTSSAPAGRATASETSTAAGQHVNPLQAFHSEQQQGRRASPIAKTNRPGKPH
jgi:hypothetical protein